MKKTKRRTNKKLILLMLILLVGYVLTSIVYYNIFNREEYNEKKVITYWIRRDVINIYDGIYNLSKTVSNAEFAKIISNYLGLKNKTYDFAFKDVALDHWAYEYIAACVQYGILKGDGIGSFFPDDKITRQEVVAALAQITSYKSANPIIQLEKAKDNKSVAPFATNAFGTFIDNGVINLYEDGTIKPENKITLIELLNIMYYIDKDNVWKIPKNVKDTNIIKDFYWYSNNVDNLKIFPSIINGEIYLLLPNISSIESFSLKFSNKDEKNVTFSGNLGETSESVFDIRTISAPNSDGIYYLKMSRIIDGNRKEEKINVLCSKNINTMFLFSENPSNKGRRYVETVKENSTEGNMFLITESGDIIYDGELSQIKTRGNSTATYPKKPYQIKLDTKADLLGNGEKVKTWVLLSNYGDASSILDKICKDLAKNMGMSGTPDSDWVNLYYDGEYRGVYLLSEKVDTGATGLNIYDLETEYENINENYDENIIIDIGKNSFGNEIQYVSNIVDPPKINEGYLIELNQDICDENSCFKTTQGLGFNIKIPENLSKNAVTYISEFYQMFEDAVYAKDDLGNYTGINPKTGKAYYEYCDLNSLVQMYMIYQFSHNMDSYFRSTYFYLSDGKLYAGPMWDGDLTFGTAWNVDIQPNSELWNDYLVSMLEKIPSFKKAVKEYYEKSFRNISKNFVNESILQYVNKISNAEIMNHIIWPVYYQWANEGKSYSENTNYNDIIDIKTTWMLKRIEYLDQKILGW